METIILFTNDAECNREKQEMQYAVESLGKLKNLLCEHNIKLSQAIVDSAASDGVLIYESVRQMGLRAIQSQPAVLRKGLEEHITAEANNLLRSVHSLRDKLRLASSFEGLIDLASAKALPHAEAAIIERNSIVVKTEQGKELYDKHRAIAKQIGELLKDIRPELRSHFVDSVKHDYDNPEGGIYMDAFPYDTCQM